MGHQLPSLLADSDITLRIEQKQHSVNKLVTSIPNSQWIPAYHTLIERNISRTIQSDLKPFIRPIIRFEPSEMMVNDFKIGSTIGSGQFGKVFKALDKSDPKRKHIVALKRINKLKPKYSMNQLMRQIAYWKQFNIETDDLDVDLITRTMNVDRCRWEIYLMKRMTYDNKGNSHIVKFIQCLDSLNSKDIWIVTEWCNLGELQWKRPNTESTLNQWQQILNDKNISVMEFAIKALDDLSKGLQFLNEAGCIHRDIKPSNILVDGNQKKLKISDFGCGLLIPESLPFKYDPSNEIKLKQLDIINKCFEKELNKIIGTPAFVPPELCKFTSDGSTEDECSKHKSLVKDGFKLDVWSLGVTLHCIIFNKLPFSGENEFDTYHLINSQTLTLDKKDDTWLSKLVVTKMLEKNPDIRVSIKDIRNLIHKNKLKKSPSMNKIGGNAKKSLKKFWKKISSSKSTEKLSLKETKPIDDPNLTAISSNTSFSSGLDVSDEPINITDFIDSLTTNLPVSSDEGGDVSNRALTSQENGTKTRRSSSSSSSSSSQSTPSLGVPTPIKNMIKIKASPEKSNNDNRQDATETDLLTDKNLPNHPTIKMKPSKNIINFKNYIQDDKDVESSDTIDQIKDYLNYKGDFT
ncbi:similar to Saccharomyces cerevisiae YKL048C ELM1 Serine/threonine protein kinase that regulates cellular morphogenesis, septin behavior, and cytokinesis [Maudiozyma saulgeensis]|uniref:Similar to Saccharomyces cerevisiae YKL048C ELM1 Serine/threonine protein kinase that regulates cellular morphogenesis, septin behavior, and cytokinesis n=1 Tax=Maudiozyma saulgeensis TaxID=1789683 RepID=A0A1X7QWH7_9SACH|nr:similar to Saccharomyces cerevisiae YKL048C ELM1 Serine/threonine protein kinase that regulates cellular morphogenesis, septin behavior, and cytokinesis [Kazachstania saulgeensis]